MTNAFRWMTTACMAGAMGLSITGCKMGDASTDKSDSNGMKNSMMESKDIIDTATGPGMTEVTTLVTAVKAAGLVDTLKGPGPFTVFAPTNAAFAKLPAGTVDDLLKPENKEKLKSILLYHVHTGDAIMAKDAKTMELSTAEGQPLNIKVDGDTVMVNNAKVIKANIVCSNGIIHWIDTVVMPPQM
jgi:uncharacterized surface protein with fasciclin (FAS1) repeats